MLLGHALMALVMDVSPPPVATLHAAVTMVVALWAVFFARHAIDLVCAAAYVASCEVLWRMTSASIPWEMAKYALVFIAASAIYRFVPRPRRLAVPLLILALILPSAVVTIERFGFFGAASGWRSTCWATSP